MKRNLETFRLLFDYAKKQRSTNVVYSSPLFKVRNGKNHRKCFHSFLILNSSPPRTKINQKK